MTASSKAASVAMPSVAEVYDAHAAFVWRTVRYLGVAAADAEDVSHEVFIVVQRKLPDYDPGRPLRAWIAGITRNVVMHHHRGRQRSAARERRVALETDDATNEPPLPDQYVAQKEAAQLVSEFLDGLRPEYREVFVLGEIEGLSGPEIAEVLGKNVNTVYSWLRSVRLEFNLIVKRHERERKRTDG